jgi:adenylate cyclase
MLRKRLIPTLFGLVIVIALVMLRAADPYPIQIARQIAFDFYQQLAPRPAADWPIRVVDIDEVSLHEIGQWPWPRDQLALLTDRLTELGAAAIAYDVLFPEPDRMSPRRIATGMSGIDPATLPDTDEQFAAAIAQSPVVLGFADSGTARTMPSAPKAGIAISGTDPVTAVPKLRGAVMPLPQFVDAATGLGTLSLNTEDLATTVRRLPLIWSDGKQYFPSLTIEALRIALGASNIVILGETDAPFVESVRVGDYVIPTMPEGDLWLHYRPPDPTLYVSAKDILGDNYKSMADRIAGQIIFVGTSASGLLDIHGTTLGDNVPGVSIHAQALEQILSEDYLIRADWVSGLEVVGFAFLGGLLVIIVLSLGPLAGLLAGAASLIAVMCTSWFAFRGIDAGSLLQLVLSGIGLEPLTKIRGVMLDPSFPLIGLTLVYAAMVFFQFVLADSDKRQIRRAFGYYVAPSLLSQIERNSESLKLGGEMRELTVMFSDVRGFTPLSEQLSPSRIVTLLNVLFSALGKRIVKEMGTIDKFIGDAIMAFWNAPVDVPEHARRACLAALGMRAELRLLNEKDAFSIRHAGIDREQINVGIGIATGPALVGNMGLETRFDYSCIGDTVNTASRVEGACKSVGYDIVVTAETRSAASDFAFLTAGAIALKGKAHPVQIHALVGNAETATSPAFAALETEHERTVAALRKGADIAAGVDRCIELCRTVDPGLVGFYQLLAERREDFDPQPEPARLTPDRTAHAI